MAVMNSNEFVSKLKQIATDYKTLYVMGCFGAPMSASNKTRYSNYTDYNKKPIRQKMINSATADTFGFDCVCLIKGVLWGWNGNKSKTYGGAAYQSNGVPDISTEGMLSKCSDVSSDFNKISVGEYLWMQGHAGVYIGDGLCVECTPSWENKVQITAVLNIGSKSGYNGRKWTKHGKLPWIEYVAAPKPVEPTTTTFKVGDIVNFTGNKHYTNTTATSGYDCTPGKAKLTKIASGKHPYHLIGVNGESTVYGWVDAQYVEKIETTPKTYKVGDIVTFTGNKHYISANTTIGFSCKSGKAKITKIHELGKSKHPYHLVNVSGGGSTVYGWVNASDIK